MQRWPNPSLESLLKSCRVDNADIQVLCLIPGLRFRNAVLNAPLVAAACTVFGSVPAQAGLLLLQQIRAFDESWFDQAHSLFVGLLLCSNPEALCA
jgi:hypothetical protein